MVRTLIAAALFAATPASVPYDAEVSQALFDICPGVMAGKVDLGNAQDLAAIVQDPTVLEQAVRAATAAS